MIATITEDKWQAIAALHPGHRMQGSWHGMYRGTDGYCSDESPHGWGNFGCQRCDAINTLLNRGCKIHPRTGRNR